MRRLLQKALSSLLYPTRRVQLHLIADWYVRKGYGKPARSSGMPWLLDPFQDFVHRQQKNPKSHYHQEFKTLSADRLTLNAQHTLGEVYPIDGVKLTPQDTSGKPGEGLHMIQLWGARIPYEARFADLATSANRTGATQYSFNPFGMNASKGEVYELHDVVNCTLAMINHLLDQGISPDKIVLMGDCLGAGVMQAVQTACEEQGIKIRLINSNSFQSLKKHLQEELKKIHASYLVPFVKPLLQHLGWHMTPGKSFAYQTPYKTYLHRQNDKVLSRSKLHEKIKKIRDNPLNTKYRDDCPVEYQAHREYLEQHCEVVVPSTKAKTDPHLMPLSACYMADDRSKDVYTGYINTYLESSNEYINAHPQQVDANFRLQALASSNYLRFKDKKEEATNYEAFWKIIALLRNKILSVIKPMKSYLNQLTRKHSNPPIEQIELHILPSKRDCSTSQIQQVDAQPLGPQQTSRLRLRV